jgi:hypothetical protein
MRVTDAERARAAAQELVELLGAYQQELAAWAPWTPAAAALGLGLGEAIVEARELIAAAQPAPRQVRAH